MTTITDLPNEILRKIFTSSDNLQTLQKVSNVCRTFKNLHFGQKNAKKEVVNSRTLFRECSSARPVKANPIFCPISTVKNYQSWK